MREQCALRVTAYVDMRVSFSFYPFYLLLSSPVLPRSRSSFQRGAPNSHGKGEAKIHEFFFQGRQRESPGTRRCATMPLYACVVVNKRTKRPNMFICICVCMYVCVCVCVCVCVYTHTHTHTHTERERERKANALLTSDIHRPIYMAKETYFPVKETYSLVKETDVPERPRTRRIDFAMAILAA